MQRWITLIAVALALGALLSYASGCSVLQPNVEAPEAVVGAYPGIVTATATIEQAEVQQAKVQALLPIDMADWQVRIDDAKARRDFIDQIGLNFLTAIEGASPMIAGVPVLGPALIASLPLIGGLLGQGRLNKQKQRSYNAGIEIGKKAILDARNVGVA